MTITFEAEIGKSNIENFTDFSEFIYQQMMSAGRELIQKALESYDLKLMAERDVKRYRNKGRCKRTIKTKLGEISYFRRVYVDLAEAEQTHCVYLLDEAVEMEQIGFMSKDICQLAAEAACGSSYRDAAKEISHSTGLEISHTGVWNLVQKMGEQQEEVIERHTELLEEGQSVGCISTPILYEENDGIWLHLQGEDRAKHGKSKEMKLGIAYDGVTWTKSKNGKKRRILDKKMAYATFDSAKKFEKHKRALIASRFKLADVELIVKNGDSAGWIQKSKDADTITVLDEFHRNKKLMECVVNKEFAHTLRELLFKGDIDGLLNCISAQITTLEVDENNQDEVEKLRELLRYYTENKESLLGYYDRGKEIPPTRKPGEIHHARLGSMESNVFTLIGNRMKGRRANWSIKGANHLSLLLCLHHTLGFKHLFMSVPVPEIEPEWVDDGKPLSGKEALKAVGKGYEYPHKANISESHPWLRKLFKPLSFSDICY